MCDFMFSGTVNFIICNSLFDDCIVSSAPIGVELKKMLVLILDSLAVIMSKT